MLQEAEPLKDQDGTELARQCAEAEQTSAILNRITGQWHDETPHADGLLFELHLANFELWHLEDQARDVTSGDAAVARTKRSIDRVNQRRNDTVEAIDVALLADLSARDLLSPSAPLHSETPGQMFDRLSILALKIYHTAVESMRQEAAPQHRAQSEQRLQLLKQQQQDLACCLASLWADLLAGERRFKLYRQMKMYNDPNLNPVLYSATVKR